MVAFSLFAYYSITLSSFYVDFSVCIFFFTIELFQFLSSVNQLPSPYFGAFCFVLLNCVYSTNLVCHLLNPWMTATKMNQVESVAFHVWFHLPSLNFALEAMIRRETEPQCGMCRVCGVGHHAMYIF